ncbi:MAG: type II toxin-antitoxin system VapC family toxin [Candidatus Njordarchaeia archaeon]
MYLVDTNIFLEVMLSQERKEECKRLLRAIKNGKITAVITDFSVYSIMILMYRLKKVDEIETFLSSLVAYRGLHIYSLSLMDKINVVRVVKEKGLDVDDAIQYAVGLALKVKGIISFDKHFDNLEIPRLEPRNLLS